MVTGNESSACVIIILSRGFTISDGGMSFKALVDMGLAKSGNEDSAREECKFGMDDCSVCGVSGPKFDWSSAV